ncbi:ABC transporter permease [Actinotalea sp.]|uniref:ABC transporter permease n=1 Tax=Actinotalea sp. TaxID=1872145 RepID=UPI00356678AF
MAVVTALRPRSIARTETAPRARRTIPPLPAAARPIVWGPTVVALVLVGLAWQAVAAGNPYILPRLPAVGTAFLADPLLFVSNAWATLQIALLGLVYGFGVAFVLAVLTSEFTLLRRAIMPLASVLNVTPVVALAPGLVVAFGFGMAPKVIVTAIITFFPVLANVSTGLRSVQGPVLDVFHTLQASRLEVLRRLRIPSAMPYTIAALRVTLPLSVVGAVVAEFVAAGSSTGLGTVIKTSAANSQLAQMYAAIGCLALLGVLMLAVITAFERRLLFWHESQQRRR